jgi:polysaccharide export outer membrane protein
MHNFKVSFFCAVTLVAGCTGGGPNVNAILKADNAQRVELPVSDDPFVLVELGQKTASAVSASIAPLTSFLPSAGQQPFVIGKSDILAISIVSNNEEGFIDFAQSAISPLSTVNLPSQEVGQDGRVAVPTIGRVQAAGMTTAAFEEKLTDDLSRVLVNPTAVVRMDQRNSAKASVIGSVAAPGSYPIELSSHHLLEVIGLAGGPTRQTSDLIVSLSRGGITNRARLSDIYANAQLNVHVRRNDVISIEPNLTRVQVLGGTTTNSQFEFETVDVDLIDVLSEAGGLLNRRAALRGVFVYRNAPANQLTAIGAELTAFDVAKPIPTVFRLDMREPTSFFTGSDFKMMDGDIVYIADNLNEQINSVSGAGTTIVPAPVEFIRDSEFNRAF